MPSLPLAQSVVLMSIAKPVLMLATLAGWGWVVGKLDKDAAYFYLKRQWWNLLQMAAGILGFGLMLLIPIFWIGWRLIF